MDNVILRQLVKTFLGNVSLQIDSVKERVILKVKDQQQEMTYVQFITMISDVINNNEVKAL